MANAPLISIRMNIVKPLTVTYDGIGAALFTIEESGMYTIIGSISPKDFLEQYGVKVVVTRYKHTKIFYTGEVGATGFIIASFIPAGIILQVSLKPTIEGYPSPALNLVKTTVTFA